MSTPGQTTQQGVTPAGYGRFNKEEMDILRRVFKDNDSLLKLMRKVFLPGYEYDAPLGQAFDLWMTIDIKNLSIQDAYVRMLARNELITHVEQMLIQLQLLSKIDDATTTEEKRKKDSLK